MGCKICLDDEFDDESLKVGHIIKFRNNDIQVPTEESHPHIIIAKCGKWCYSVCGTSKKETVIHKSKLKHGGNMTLYPVIASNAKYCLKHDTYFYCEDIYPIHCNDFMDKYQAGEIVEMKSRLSFGDYQLIVNAVEQSDTCDISDLFIVNQVEYEQMAITTEN